MIRAHILAAALPLLAGCTELRDLRVRTEIQDREIARLRAELTEQQAVYNQLLTQYEGLQAQLARDTQALRVENERLRTSQSLREQELATRTAQLEQTLQQAQTALSTREMESTQLRTQSLTLQQQLEQATSSRDSLQRQVAEIERDLAALGQIVGGSAGQQQTAASLNERLAQVTAGLQARNQEIEQLRSQVSQAQAGGFSEAALTRIADYLRQAVGAVSGPQPVITQDRQRGVSVTFPSSDLFESGSTNVTSSARASLTALGYALVQLPETSVNVVGHTDNQPVTNMPFSDNWQLSASRAENVMRVLLQEGGVPAARVRFSGAADSQPVGSNGTAEGRQRNRRVEIVVTPDRPQS